MLAKTAEFKCGEGDIKCLCSNKNFGYGFTTASLSRSARYRSNH